MADINNSKLLQINAGILKKNACVVIVRTEWNAGIVDELEAGCVRQLKQSGLADVKVIIVPGAFEIAFANVLVEQCFQSCFQARRRRLRAGTIQACA